MRLGDAAFFPTREQLKRIGAAVLGWLAANPDEPERDADRGPTCDLCGVPITKDNVGQCSFDPVTEDSSILCAGCTGKLQRQHAQGERIGRGQRATLTTIDEPALPPDLRESPLSEAPDGATYTIGCSYWVRRGGRWVSDLPF